MQYVNSLLDLIGNTPLVRLSRTLDLPDGGADAPLVLAKVEYLNPGGSVKDRIASRMIEAAEASGELQPGGTIVEPTSGNTGVALAMAAAVRGYRLVLVMPESMSIERRRLMAAYGAELELTRREDGMKGAIARADELVSQIDGAWMPQQFDNPANPEIHRDTTAAEILRDFPDGIDFLITGVGTGGHITGCAQVLKARWPGLKVFAVEPSASPVISGGAPSPHPIQGIGAGFIPKNLDVGLLDGVIQVDAEPAREMARRCAAEEGMLVGISSGATLAAIAQKLCPRFGLTQAETETVAWLVEHHLLMSMTAQSRDLSDPKTIEKFSAVVQTLERLRLLTILLIRVGVVGHDPAVHVVDGLAHRVDVSDRHPFRVDALNRPRLEMVPHRLLERFLHRRHRPASRRPRSPRRARCARPIRMMRSALADGRRSSPTAGRARWRRHRCRHSSPACRCSPRSGCADARSR